MNARMDTTDVCDLRFGQVGISSVRVRRADAAALYEELERRVRTAPQLFSRAAVILDLSHLLNLPDDGTVDALLEAIRSAGMPCRPRQASSSGNEVASAAPAEASAYTAMPVTSTGLRPTASDSAPWNRLIAA